jgi:hypothetical protein
MYSYVRLHVKYVSAVLVRYKCNLITADRFSKNTLISNLKARTMVADLFHEDRQTYRHDEANSVFIAILRKRLIK